MKYFLRVCSLGPNVEIVIDQEIFNRLKKARACLSDALAIEEKYELLLSNYLDLEKECLNATLDHMVRDSTCYASFFDIRLAFNRRVVNLLTSTKLYIDQIAQHVKPCVSDDADIANKVKNFFTDEYDQYFEYRFMEALRNYVQHRGLAVHSTTLGGERIPPFDEDGKTEYKTRLFTHKAEVECDSAFKKQVSKDMPEKVELINAARVYISSISKVHSKIRALVTCNADESRNLILNTIKQYEDVNNNKSVALHAICSIPKRPIDETVEKFPLLLEWDDIRINLIEKNLSLTELKSRYVSSK